MLLDALFGVARLGVMAVAPTITLVSDATVSLPKNLGDVDPVIFGRHWTQSDSDCKYSGVVVPYARDWELMETSGHGETRRPPEPGEIAGYAILLNKTSSLLPY